MKPRKIKINGETYQPRYGMAVIEYIGNRVGTDKVNDIFGFYFGLNLTDCTTKDLRHIAILICSAIELGEGECSLTEEDVIDWIYSDVKQVVDILNTFGESISKIDNQGNHQAPTKGARRLLNKLRKAVA